MNTFERNFGKCFILECAYTLECSKIYGVPKLLALQYAVRSEIARSTGCGQICINGYAVSQKFRAARTSNEAHNAVVLWCCGVSTEDVAIILARITFHIIRAKIITTSSVETPQHHKTKRCALHCSCVLRGISDLPHIHLYISDHSLCCAQFLILPHIRRMSF